MSPSGVLRDAFAWVGVIHLLPLPGSPAGGPGLRAVTERALGDGQALVDAGWGTAIVENFGDSPFEGAAVGPEVVASMTAVAAALRDRLGDPGAGGLRLGINVLRNDACAAMAIAAAVGADFIRVNVHVGASWTDQGLVVGDARRTLLLRRSLGAGSVAIAADVHVKHGSPAGTRPIDEEAEDAMSRGGAEVVIVTGPRTGAEADLDVVRRLRGAGRRVWVGSGVRDVTAAQVRQAADGAIVGSWLHEDGRIDRPIDVERARRLLISARDDRGSTGRG